MGSIGSFICLFFLYSCEDCSKKIPCPGYEDALLDAWFPYKNGQQLIFKTSGNKTDTFRLQLSDSTVAYDSREANGCNAFKSFRAIETDSFFRTKLYITMGVSQPAYSTDMVRGASINLFSGHFNGTQLTQDGFESFSGESGTNLVTNNLRNFSLNGITYPVVQSVQKDTINNKQVIVYKIYLAKNFGIIAFEKNPGAELWIKE